MLISAQYLVDRLRQPRSRADEVRRVRERLVAAGRDGSDAERTLALELRALRTALASEFAGVRACASCARGRPEPNGHWPGGRCCGTDTENVFADDEVLALALAGTTPSSLVAPRSDQAGCAFRGPTGCSLAVEDRPNVCVSYVCAELEAELGGAGGHELVLALVRELRAKSARFAALRALRRGVPAERGLAWRARTHLERG